ncbi:uncharacterized protein LOC107268071 isoform X2 [Cephus cinctus]|uniref:Uncharacterized protein LOC107268071 isoform X2 n=1 Tax=Cephus cinctus TaxID=211228 RepID=A0AAJ7BXG2_CEPCN|nr:uncharacterized protein LOC107268071 isoform X2 [Cephus cinctus]
MQKTDISFAIQKAKKQLMSRDKAAQTTAVEWLNNELQTESAAARNLLVEKLINSDIVSVLCEALVCSRGQLLMSVLQCLEIFSGNEKFYRHNHALYAVESILRIGHLMTKNTDEVERLGCAVCTLFVILSGAKRLAVPVERICNAEQIFEFLGNLITTKSPSYLLRFSASKILCLMMDHALPRIRNDDLVVILPLYIESLRSMRSIIEQIEIDEKYILNAMTVICRTCALGTRFCSNEDYVNEGSRGFIDSGRIVNAQHRSSFALSTYSTMMEVIIPRAREIKTSCATIYLNLVSCLNDLYRLRDCNCVDLSNHLAAKGYLKYLSRLTTFPTQDMNRAILLLLSRILVTLSVDSLPAENWPGGLNCFKQFIVEGVMSLPKYYPDWKLLLATHGIDADAFLLIVYYHFLSTCEEDDVLLESLVEKILTLPYDKVTPAAIVKPLWLLFAVSALSHTSLSSVKDYEKCVQLLNCLILKADAHKCYTHHPALLYHCIHSGEISLELKAKVVQLWLESDGDMKSLIEADCVESTCHSLLNAVETGSAKVVDLAVKGICELTRVKESAEKMAVIVWEILPRILTSYTPETSINVRGMLEIADVTPPRRVSSATIKCCAILLMKTFVRSDVDVSLKTLTVNQAYTMLLKSISRKDSKDLLTCGFSKENLDLATASLKILSLIVLSQTKLLIQCENSLPIEMMDVFRELANESKSLCIMHLLHVLLNYKMDKPAVTFRQFRDDQERAISLQSLYRILHVVHAKNGVEVRDLVYSCLSGVLKCCYSSGDKETLKNLTEQHFTALLIKMTIVSGHISTDFLEFLSCWLHYRKIAFDISVAQERDKSRALSRDCFERTLDILVNFLKTIDTAQPDIGDVLSRIKQSIKIFDPSLISPNE